MDKNKFTLNDSESDVDMEIDEEYSTNNTTINDINNVDNVDNIDNVENIENTEINADVLNDMRNKLKTTPKKNLLKLLQQLGGTNNNMMDKLNGSKKSSMTTRERLQHKLKMRRANEVKDQNDKLQNKIKEQITKNNKKNGKKTRRGGRKKKKQNNSNDTSTELNN